MKKQLTITGYLLRPILVGYPAYVQEPYWERTTSAVQRILEQREDCILFETRNTVYQLNYTGRRHL